MMLAQISLESLCHGTSPVETAALPTLHGALVAPPATLPAVGPSLAEPGTLILGVVGAATILLARVVQKQMSAFAATRQPARKKGVQPRRRAA